MTLLKLKFIKCVALLFAALLALASCSGAYGAERGDDSEFSLSSLDIIPSMGTAEVDALSVPLPSEFVILSQPGAENSFFASAAEQDIMSKTVFERNALLQEKYGVTISEISDADIVSRVKNDALVGKSGYDMLIIGAESAASLIIAGALTDLGSLAAFNTDGVGYHSEAIRELSLADRVFLCAGDATPSFYRAASAVVVNTELLSRVGGAKQLFNAVLDGSFTYGEMLRISGELASLNNSDEIVLPFSAISTSPEDSLDLFLSGGGSFYHEDAITDVPIAASFEGENLDIYRAYMELFGIDTDGGETVLDETSMQMPPLFTVSSIGEAEALIGGGGPFSVLPMPKMSSAASNYICNVDFKNAAFTALPTYPSIDEAAAVTVMNLIYRHSGGLTSVLKENCLGHSGDRAALDLVFRSASCDLVTLFGFGDFSAFMESCVNENLSAKAFATRASERALAAVSALSIVSSNLSDG